ncbi:Calcineurin-like metallo-phosphoesterase superfamily protein [Actinidia rufa]|uniref:Calcineurin-like metallo-phosphoesterase superfamily protein n=1 Tax=Actinidia rufa TaxID=165716 RepID=A0A7J0GUV7_9ERIC|nr:Calcineurin-like metallo-phosphoesterase superfamily protein [Actinidia rufa]
MCTSTTIQNAVRKLLVVGVDSTMSVGLRDPTNLFGHPTDQLLTEIDSELSQWKSESSKPVTNISFVHFPLSFSAAADSGKTLKDIFLKHFLSAYPCGHLHTSFGKNLKRHHHSSDNSLTSQKFSS